MKRDRSIQKKIDRQKVVNYMRANDLAAKEREAALHERQERRRKKRSRQLIFRLSMALLALLLVIVAILLIFPVYSSARMEAGTKATVKDFLRFHFPNAAFTKDSEKFDPDVPGIYQLQIKNGLFQYHCKLTIEDTTPPELEVKDLIAGITDSYEVSSFVESAEDLTDVTVDYGKAPDASLIGEKQELSILASDTAGNTTEKKATLFLLPIIYRVNLEAGAAAPDIHSFVTDEEINEEETYIVSDLSAIDFNTARENDIEVMYQGTAYPAKICIADTQAPVFTLSESFTSFLGESIRYKTHVTVTDNSGAYDLKIDTSKVNPDAEGSYPVVYTATDESGNSSSVEITLTVAKKTADEEALFSRVDAILAEIINDNMTQREKAEAIFRYIKDSFIFVNDSDKSNYVLAANTMLDLGQGDCYSYYAIAKAMLTRAGIKNMDICYYNRPIREHYWNLVDVEDGHGWYHYDTCSNEYVPERVCLWTTAQLMEVNDGRYSYDPSQYPPIP